MDVVSPAATRALYVFTRDLRVNDHLGLAAAARVGSVIPVLVIDPLSAERLRRSPRRAAFYCAAVGALADEIRTRGSRLLVMRGRMGPIVRTLARRTDAKVVVWSLGYDARTQSADRELQSVVEEAGLRALTIHDAPVVAPEDDAAMNQHGDAYRAFIPYLARWRTIAPPVPVPEIRFDRTDIESEQLPQPAEFGSTVSGRISVSATAASEACARFLETSVLTYAIGRNVPALDGTSRLSADLAFGTLSARAVVRDVHERLRDPFLLAEEKASLRFFLRALAQRDFFLQLSWFTARPDDAPLQPKMRAFRFATKHQHLGAWEAGQTGFPIVDAGIRELHATGWMHPRVRAIAASFLCFDLGVDWRVGRDAWDRLLIEDTPALATGNWQWIAGVGADSAAYPRIYNPLRSARRFDPAASYIRRWIPELALSPDDAILDPYAAQSARQLGFDLFDAQRYPAPVLDHDAAARAFLARYRRDVSA